MIYSFRIDFEDGTFDVVRISGALSIGEARCHALSLAEEIAEDANTSVTHSTFLGTFDTRAQDALAF